MRGWVLVLAGCGLSESEFRAEQVELACVRSSACAVADGGAPRDCTSVTAPPESSLFVCTFDPEAGASCLDAIPTAPCEGPGFTNPSVCGEVFTDCVQQ